MRVHERCHAHGSRERTGPGHYHHRPVTGQPCTGLTVTFSRPAESRFEPRTGLEVGHSRSVPWTAVGHRSRGLAHHPHGVGAGAGCALGGPSCAPFLARRPRSSASRSHISRQLRAQRTRISRRPLHVVRVTRDRATGHGVGEDGECSRLSHLGPSGSVDDELTAAVEAAAEHRP